MLRTILKNILAHLRFEVISTFSEPTRLFLVTFFLLSLSLNALEMSELIGFANVLALFVTLCAAFLVLSARKIRKLSFELPRAETYEVVIPPNGHDDVREIIRRCSKFFRGSSSDPADDFDSFRRNEYSVVILRDAHGEMIAFSDMFFFRASDFERYLKGEIPGREFIADYVLPDPYAREAEVVYFPTIFHFFYFLSEGRHINREIAILVCANARNLLQYLRFPKGSVDFYAAGSTVGGENILHRLKFKRTKLVNNDGDSIWVKEGVTRGDLEDIERRYSRWGSDCNLTIRPPT